MVNICRLLGGVCLTGMLILGMLGTSAGYTSPSAGNTRVLSISQTGPSPSAGTTASQKLNHQEVRPSTTGNPLEFTLQETGRQGGYGVAWDPQSGSFDICSDGNVTIVSDTSGALEGHLAVPAGEYCQIAVDPVHQLGFVADGNLGNITIFNTTTLNIVTTIPVAGSPQGLSLDTAQGLLMWGNGTAVGFYNYLDNHMIAWLNGTVAFRLAYDQNQSLLAGTQFGSGPDVEEVLGSTHRVVSEVPVDNAPYAIVYDPNAGAFIEGGQNGAIDWFPAGPQPTVRSLGVLGDGAIEAATDVGGGQVLLLAQSGVLFNYDIAEGLLQTIDLPFTGFPYSVAFDPVDGTAMVVDPVANMDYLLNGTASSSPAPLTVPSLFQVPRDVSAGGAFQIEAYAIGGSPPYTYAYSGLPNGCSSSNSATLPCETGVAGTYSVSVQVTDTSGSAASASARIVVLGTNVTQPLTILSFSVVPPNPIVNQSFELSVAASGGNFPYTYTYSGLPPGCPSENSSVLFCRALSPGTYSATVQVRDPHGQSVGSSLAFEIFAKLSPMVTVAFSRNPAVVGVPLTISVTLIDIPTASTILYEGLPLGCVPADVPVLTCVPTEPGTYQLSVQVIYSGGQASAVQTIEVLPASYGPGPLFGPGQPWFWVAVLSLAAVAGLAALVIYLIVRPRGPPRTAPFGRGPQPPTPPGAPPAGPGS